MNVPLSTAHRWSKTNWAIGAFVLSYGGVLIVMGRNYLAFLPHAVRIGGAKATGIVVISSI